MHHIILLTQVEMKARRDKELCYSCDDIYSFEHRCVKIQLYMLKEEEEGDEEEVENIEIVFDSAGELIEVPDPEPTPIKANSGSDLVSPMLNLPELEGVKPKPETRPFVKDIKPPDSTIVTGLSQLQEVPVEASIDAKETKSGPKPTPNPNPYTPPIKPPNQNLPTLSYPNPILFRLGPKVFYSYFRIKYHRTGVLDPDKLNLYITHQDITRSRGRAHGEPRYF